MIKESQLPDYIEHEIIPKVLKIIEDSALSANQAVRIAPILHRIVDEKNCELMDCIKFHANPKENKGFPHID